MQKLKQYVENGQVELAQLDSHNRPVKVQMSDLEQKVTHHNNMANLYKSLEELSLEEKYQWSNIKRLRGNSLYKNGKIDEAIQVYLESLIGMDFKGQNRQTIAQVKNNIMYPVLLNMATCFYKKKQNLKAIELCDKILQEQRYQPCIYKKAYILIEMGQQVKARELIDQLNNNGDTKSKKQAEQLLAKLINQNNGAKEMYKRIFQSDGESGDESSPLIRGGKLQQQEEILIPRQGLFAKIFDCLATTYESILGKRNKNKQKI